MLAGSVRCRERCTKLPGDGRRDDKVTVALLRESSQDGACQVDLAKDVDVKNLTILSHADLTEARSLRATDVVDQDVDFGEVSESRGHHFLMAIRVADVKGRKGQDVVLDQLSLGSLQAFIAYALQSVQVTREHQSTAPAREIIGQLFTDARAGTGDPDDLAGQALLDRRTEPPVEIGLQVTVEVRNKENNGADSGEQDEESEEHVEDGMEQVNEIGKMLRNRDDCCWCHCPSHCCCVSRELIDQRIHDDPGFCLRISLPFAVVVVVVSVAVAVAPGKRGADVSLRSSC